MAIQGDQAFIYFPMSQTLVKWHDNTLTPLNWNLKGTPLSIRVGTDGIEVAVRRGNEFWLVKSNGAPIGRIAGATGTVMLLDDGILLTTQRELVLRRADASETHFDLTDVQALSALGSHYAQVRTRGAMYALRTEPGKEQLFSLPMNSAVDVSQATPAVSPSLPDPILDFGSAATASAQQRTLTMRLPSASPVAASGLVTITFQPDTTLVSDDPSILFLGTGTRSLPFSVGIGQTQVLLNGQSSAVFQTGTTSGRIVFTVSGVSGSLATVLTIPPATVSLDNAAATRLSNEADVSMTGFDNTLSIGLMTFTFRDATGAAIGSPIRVDFTGPFGTYFTKTKMGSSFQALIAFPVHGDTSLLGSVDVDIPNAAGTTTRHLIFH
jgi:hypothetical protein